MWRARACLLETGFRRGRGGVSGAGSQKPVRSGVVSLLQGAPRVRSGLSVEESFLRFLPSLPVALMKGAAVTQRTRRPWHRDASSLTLLRSAVAFRRRSDTGLTGCPAADLQWECGPPQSTGSQGLGATGLAQPVLGFLCGCPAVGTPAGAASCSLRPCTEAVLHWLRCGPVRLAGTPGPAFCVELDAISLVPCGTVACPAAQPSTPPCGAWP